MLFEDENFKAGKEFISFFMTNLYCRIYVPNQLIVKKGETFPEMYLINRGSVVLSIKKKEVNEYFVLPKKTYFGDYQILLNYKASECYTSTT